MQHVVNSKSALQLQLYKLDEGSLKIPEIEILPPAAALDQFTGRGV